mmetsp:Transcript_48760/g.147814  ORF Transcript_48760/g.147814 Transcript_48760/m.147814 type:complete len:276 (-) Transcript_48760:205-1032(-)
MPARRVALVEVRPPHHGCGRRGRGLRAGVAEELRREAGHAAVQHEVQHGVALHPDALHAEGVVVADDLGLCPQALELRGHGRDDALVGEPGAILRLEDRVLAPARVPPRLLPPRLPVRRRGLGSERPGPRDGLRSSVARALALLLLGRGSLLPVRGVVGLLRLLVPLLALLLLLPPRGAGLATGGPVEVRLLLGLVRDRGRGRPGGPLRRHRPLPLDVVRLCVPVVVAVVLVGPDRLPALGQLAVLLLPAGAVGRARLLLLGLGHRPALRLHSVG